MPHYFTIKSLLNRRAAWSILPCAAAAVLLAVMINAHHREAAILRADPETILSDPDLRETALAAGTPVYMRYCASCHGATGKGDNGFGVPDLTDDDRLYGFGTVAENEDIARFGIRTPNKRGWNLAVMPAYASAVPDKAELLPPQSPADIEDMTQFLLSFTARATDNRAAARGRVAFDRAGCWDCHGRDAGGDPAIGAPTLTDDIWLYGGGHDDIHRSIARGRAGLSPAFGDALSPAQLRAVAVYVASLAPSHPEKK